MRFLYSTILVFSIPLVLLYFLFRGLRDRAYLQRWTERFGYFPDKPKPGGILIHAASVGEFNAASPLIKALKKNFPELSITVTTLTPTGSARVKDELGEKVFHGYIPVDLPWIMKSFLRQVQPSVIIVMETEIWPNFFLAAQQQKIPLLMANARLSERSVQRFSKLGPLVKNVLNTVEWVGAQSADDARRLVSCGAQPNRTKMTGNLKFDLNVPASLEETAAAIRAKWGQDRPVLVAGSTHEDDENIILPAFLEILEKQPNALLVLVPRYPERFERAAQEARNMGLSVELRSQSEVCDQQTQCFVIDAIGELMIWYACADVSFVGGSVGDQGGHNALEPAALAKPVLFGPKMVNAREIADQLLSSNAAREVIDQRTFKETAEEILSDGNLRDQMGQAGRKLVEKNKGALLQTMAAVKRVVIG